MSTASSAPGTKLRLRGDKREIKIVQHSQLLYWWPVWLFGFIFATITYAGGDRMAILPPIAAVTIEDVGGGPDAKRVARLELKDKHRLTRSLDEAEANTRINEDPFPLRVSDRQGMGVLFIIITLLVIVITNVPLRGMWSVIVIMLILLISIILYLMNAWEYIFGFFRFLHIHINTGGYLFLAIVLFIVWVLTVAFFDRQVYMIFTPGQLRVREEIGGAETAYDTMGMVTKKHRDDLFRHWILGAGSGDLTVRTSGANAHEFNFHNVLFVGWKLRAIEEMLRDRPVVSGE